MQQQPRRTERSAGGIIGAFLAVFGVIAFVWGLTWFQQGRVEDPARTIDYRPALSAARAQAPFPVLTPEPVPAGLRATSVTWDAVGPQKSWQLGFVTPDAQFIGLYEGNGPAAELIDAWTPARTPGPPVSIGGVQWLTLTNSDRGETALVRTASRVTTVVTGTVDKSALVGFVRSLH